VHAAALWVKKRPLDVHAEYAGDTFVDCPLACSKSAFYYVEFVADERR